MDEKKLILDALEDPEVLEKVVSRRDAFGSMGAWGTGLALASVPFALAAMTKRAFAQVVLPDQIVNVLNFALVLEYLEAEFYRMGLAAPGLIPPGLRDVFQTISRHENAHVAFLRAVLGAQAARRPEFDFTAGGMFPDVFTNFRTFATLAQGFEDTGVRAYKGQAPKLQGNALILTAALRIHSVEARHAAMIRRLDASPAEEGWIPFDRTNVPALQPVYAGEANVLHAGINAAEVTNESLEAVTEAFDEPLGLREVLAIAGMFGTGRRTATTFTVRIENVSRPGTLNVPRLNGVVPLSPGVFAVFQGSNPLFTVGEMADEGTERIAEDGFPMFKAPTVANIPRVSSSGVFASAGGSSGNPALGPGESTQFDIIAVPGERLQIETMFVQSNDWFYAFGGEGLDLFDGNNPIRGDVTSQLVLYDAGTEQDTPPGTGPFQKPVQPPNAINVGPAENVPIRPARERHPGFNIPPTSSVIRVTITPQ